MPKLAPDYRKILGSLSPERMAVVLEASSKLVDKIYPHWDDLRYKQPIPPPFENHKEWWAALRLQRMAGRRFLPLHDKEGHAFSFTSPYFLERSLHRFDLSFGSVNPSRDSPLSSETRHRLALHSVIEEALTSSRLEGAVTTREIANEMIGTGRAARTKHERMVMNNFETMQRLREWLPGPLTPDLILDIHRSIGRDALEKEGAEGRWRRTEEKIDVIDEITGDVYHRPPPANELPRRMEALCRFANTDDDQTFIHPVVRAILVHFWMAYDHPFADGNGRTARALFYWSMLRSGYQLFEYISLSNVLLQSPRRYYLSFLHTETDDNDLTYFILAQVKAVETAFDNLKAYVERRKTQDQQATIRLRALAALNPRQGILLQGALEHPGQVYTIKGYKTLHRIVHQTARTDLLQLVEKGFLVRSKQGRHFIFTAPPDLARRLQAPPS